MDKEIKEKTYIMIRLSKEDVIKFDQQANMIPRTKIVRKLVEKFINGEITLEQLTKTN